MASFDLEMLFFRITKAGILLFTAPEATWRDDSGRERTVRPKVTALHLAGDAFGGLRPPAVRVTVETVDRQLCLPPSGMLQNDAGDASLENPPKQTQETSA